MFMAIINKHMFINYHNIAAENFILNSDSTNTKVVVINRIIFGHRHNYSLNLK